MRNISSILIVSGALLLSLGAFAEQLPERAKDPKFWQISDVKIERLLDEDRNLNTNDPNNPAPKPTLPPRPVPGRPTPGRPTLPFPTRPTNQINQFILVGEKIWDFIKENKPVVNVEKTKTLDVLPFVAGESINAFDLDAWSLPQFQTYKVSFKNGFGSDVVDIKYRVFYSYGGSYHGKGDYLTGVTIEPKSINAKWGFSVDVSSEVVSVTNVGDQENPLPALTLQLRYKVSSPMSDSENRETYTVVGDGRLIEYK